MKDIIKALEDLTWFMQLGLTVLIPILMMMVLCYWLTHRFGIGPWVYIPGVLLGLGSSAVSFHSFSKTILRRKENRIPQKKAVRFNRHL